MGIKKRSRKAPITTTTSSVTSRLVSTDTVVPTAANTSSTTPHLNPKRSRSKSSRQTQSIISTYHTLLKRRKQLLAANDGSGVAQVDEEIEEMGGLDAYQKASQMGQTKERGGDSGRVLVPWLEELGWGSSGSKGKLKDEGKDAGNGKPTGQEGGEAERDVRTLR